MLARAPRDLLRGRRVIGAWAWELPVLPAEWRIGARYVHEVWACSAFTAAPLEALAPGRVRVVPYPLALAWHPTPAPPRAAYGLAEDAVVTTVIFSLGSSFTRKNPLAAIAAFRTAFGNRRDQLLALKLSGAAAFPDEVRQIAAAAGQAANIRIFPETWPTERVEGLLAVSDVVLSLHRAEGLGLVPAQAMLRGIPVVATGWSGNLQYMDDCQRRLGQLPADPRSPTPPAFTAASRARSGPTRTWTTRRPPCAGSATTRRPASHSARGGAAKARLALNGDELRAALTAAGITAG